MHRMSYTQPTEKQTKQKPTRETKEPHAPSHSPLLLRLSDQGGSGSGLVLEGRGQLLLLDVVTSETVDPGLDQNESAGEGEQAGEEVWISQLGREHGVLPEG